MSTSTIHKTDKGTVNAFSFPRTAHVTLHTPEKVVGIWLRSKELFSLLFSGGTRIDEKHPSLLAMRSAIRPYLENAEIQIKFSLKETSIPQVVSQNAPLGFIVQFKEKTPAYEAFRDCADLLYPRDRYHVNKGGVKSGNKISFICCDSTAKTACAFDEKVLKKRFGIASANQPESPFPIPAPKVKQPLPEKTLEEKKEADDTESLADEKTSAENSLSVQTLPVERESPKEEDRPRTHGLRRSVSDWQLFAASPRIVKPLVPGRKASQG